MEKKTNTKRLADYSHSAENIGRDMDFREMQALRYHGDLRASTHIGSDN